MSSKARAWSVLGMNTLAFGVCFAVWMMNGVLITYLVDHGTYGFSTAEMGWLIGIPVLTGSIFRLPVGVLTDKYGGRPVYAIVMILAALGAWAVSYADGFVPFLLGGLAFGLAGTAFAVGIAYTSVWFPRNQQGTALGIFGTGNAGAAVTSLLAPSLLDALTEHGADPEGWRWLPRIYALALIVMTVIFWVFTFSKKVDEGSGRTLSQRMRPLAEVRVWRFGLYYFLVFGAFVALAQWLIPYYVNVYAVSVATAGLLASVFSLPSGVIRALGGWLSDRAGARSVMYWVLGGCAVFCALLVVPQMDITSAGSGVMAAQRGEVTEITESSVRVGDRAYPVRPRPASEFRPAEDENLLWPTSVTWQTPVVKLGDKVQKRQLLARGETHIYFQANIWVFTALVFAVGILMGIGKAAVYRHIPDYFPRDVGVVGGVVGVLGGLGGFFCPILFGYMLEGTGLWTSCWMFLAALSVVSLWWMHRVIRKMTRAREPALAERMEQDPVARQDQHQAPDHAAASATVAHGRP